MLVGGMILNRCWSTSSSAQSTKWTKERESMKRGNFWRWKRIFEDRKTPYFFFSFENWEGGTFYRRRRSQKLRVWERHTELPPAHGEFAKRSQNGRMKCCRAIFLQNGRTAWTNVQKWRARGRSFGTPKSHQSPISFKTHKIFKFSKY